MGFRIFFLFLFSLIYNRIDTQITDYKALMLQWQQTHTISPLPPCTTCSLLCLCDVLCVLCFFKKHGTGHMGKNFHFGILSAQRIFSSSDVLWPCGYLAGTSTPGKIGYFSESFSLTNDFCHDRMMGIKLFGNGLITFSGLLGSSIYVPITVVLFHPWLGLTILQNYSAFIEVIIYVYNQV